MVIVKDCVKLRVIFRLCKIIVRSDFWIIVLNEYLIWFWLYSLFRLWWGWGKVKEDLLFKEVIDFKMVDFM